MVRVLLPGSPAFGARAPTPYLAYPSQEQQLRAIADRVFEELYSTGSDRVTSVRKRPDIPKPRLENLVTFVAKEVIGTGMIETLDQVCAGITLQDPVQIALYDLKQLVDYAGKDEVREKMKIWATPDSSPLGPSPIPSPPPSPEPRAPVPLTQHHFTVIKMSKPSLFQNIVCAIHHLFLRHIIDVTHDLFAHKIFS